VIVEAIDTAYTIGAAILAWIAVLAAVATVVLFTGVLVGAWAWRAVRKRLTGSLAAERPPHAPEPTPTPERRPTPSWAREAHDHQEAA
jgi:hypothetical protein